MFTRQPAQYVFRPESVSKCYVVAIPQRIPFRGELVEFRLLDKDDKILAAEFIVGEEHPKISAPFLSDLIDGFLSKGQSEKLLEEIFRLVYLNPFLVSGQLSAFSSKFPEYFESQNVGNLLGLMDGRELSMT